MRILKPLRAAGVGIGAAIAFAVTLALPTDAQDTYLGSREFAVSCAVCHGATAKGDGEMASLLTVKPADLTILARRNGGEFPFKRVVEVIDGRAEVSAHGNRVMPIWGDRYQEEIEQSEQHELLGPEIEVSSRINDLAHFIASIQQK